MLLDNPPLAGEPTAAVNNPAKEQCAELLRVMELLGHKDRLVLEMALRHGLSRRELALLLNLAPGSVSRKVRALLGRLSDPIVLLLADEHCSLPRRHRRLGLEYFLEGLSIAELIERHRISRPEVNQMLEYIRGWQRGLAGGR